MRITSLQVKTKALEDLASIFEYPYADYRAHVGDWIESHQEDFASAGESLTQFQQSIAKLTDHELEEVFTRTFDMAPICSPYISGHVYGADNFERGTLLTALNDRYKDQNFDTHGELPDHIALLLRFSPQMEDEEFQELVEFCLTKPLEEMESNLSDNPYQYAVHAIREILHEGVEASTND